MHQNRIANEYYKIFNNSFSLFGEICVTLIFFDILRQQQIKSQECYNERKNEDGKTMAEEGILEIVV